MTAYTLVDRWSADGLWRAVLLYAAEKKLHLGFVFDPLTQMSKECMEFLIRCEPELLSVAWVREAPGMTPKWKRYYLHHYVVTDRLAQDALSVRSSPWRWVNPAMPTQPHVLHSDSSLFLLADVARAHMVLKPTGRELADLEDISPSLSASLREIDEP
ncbi:hypothetical protein [Actinopolymorpha alba]|uniref:hypothetical protein n=1 Tax=Actinopolymorpha alba TaxID=533267 RepID=UPI0003666E09|nr:hypothetical protein [Actinopolymorpha alba]